MLLLAYFPVNIQYLLYILYTHRRHYWLTRATIALKLLPPTSILTLACLAMLTLISHKDLLSVGEKQYIGSEIKYENKLMIHVLLSRSCGRLTFIMLSPLVKKYQSCLHKKCYPKHICNYLISITTIIALLVFYMALKFPKQ